jgi:hypothetical protein
MDGTSPDATDALESIPSVAKFSSNTATVRASLSTKVATAAPREIASIPSAPLPHRDRARARLPDSRADRKGPREPGQKSAARRQGEPESVGPTDFLQSPEDFFPYRANQRLDQKNGWPTQYIDSNLGKTPIAVSHPGENLGKNTSFGSLLHSVATMQK